MNIEHKINIVPIFQEEWRGSKPTKWRGNKKIIKPKDNNPFDRIRLKFINLASSGLGIRMRRNFTAKISEEMIFKPGLKLFNETKFKTEIEDK